MPHQNKATQAPTANVRTQYDRLALFKHSEVYPSAEELEQVQTVISHVECALKSVSLNIALPQDAAITTEGAVATEEAISKDENVLTAADSGEDAAVKSETTSKDDATLADDAELKDDPLPKDSEVPKTGCEKSVKGR